MHEINSENKHVYIFRPVWWLLLLRVFSSFLVIIIILIPVLFFALPFLFQRGTNEPSASSLPGILWFAIPYTLFAFASISYRMSVAVSLFFSYTKTTPEGIEFKYWPFAHIRGRWQDVDAFGSNPFTNQTLYLNQFEKLGLCISYTALLNKYRGPKGMISINDTYRNKETTLISEVQKYIPHLLQQETKIGLSSGISSTDRLLAIISHGSIIMSWAGVFLPIIILIFQSGKSNYVKYQAIQALLWQLFAIGIRGLFYVALIIGLATISYLSAGQYPGSEFTGVGFFQSAMVLISVFGVQFILMIYPIIGIIKIAQGKEFQYAVIGKLIRKK